MFRHLLVPLDGSSLAEAALPAAAYLARALGSTVTLLHVVERSSPQEVHGDRHLTDPEQAAAYLDEVAARAVLSGVVVEQHVHAAAADDVARSIVEHKAVLAPDLIVMCAHGSGGLRRWLYGTIAQQVIALGRIPTLVVRPTGSQGPQPFVCRKLLVPIDGHPEHEQGLPIAIGLARACAADLHLLMVIHTFRALAGQQAASARLLPGTTSELLDITSDSARAYLQQRAGQAQAQGLTVTAEIRRGDPARQIVQSIRVAGADVVVLSTHGRAGMDALWAGSVVPRISRHVNKPLLLVPVQRTESTEQGPAASENG
jgi:nucleotide-binding universal stress UspA family protein